MGYCGCSQLSKNEILWCIIRTICSCFSGVHIPLSSIHHCWWNMITRKWFLQPGKLWRHYCLGMSRINRRSLYGKRWNYWRCRYWIVLARIVNQIITKTFTICSKMLFYITTHQFIQVRLVCWNKWRYDFNLFEIIRLSRVGFIAVLFISNMREWQARNGFYWNDVIISEANASFARLNKSYWLK